MKDKLGRLILGLIFVFLIFTLFFSKYSELTFIYHSYLFSTFCIIIFLVFSVATITKGTQISIETSNPIIWVLIFLFFGLIFSSSVKYDSIEETYRIISPVLLFLVLLNIIRTDEERKISLYMFLGIGFVFVFYNYFHFYFGPGLGTSALVSNWGYQNTFGAFLVLMIQISLGVYLAQENKYLKMFLSILPMFFIFVLFLTVSRGAYIAFIVSLATLIVTTKKKGLGTLLKQLTPVILGSIFLIVFGSPKEIILANLGKSTVLVNFIGGAQDDALGNRIYMLKTAIRIFFERPIAGFGLGTFRYTYAMHNFQDKFFRIDPHSLFLKLLAETGLVGAISFTTFVLYFLFKAFKRIKQNNENDYILIGLFSGIVGLFFHMNLDVDVYPVIFIILMISLALITKNNSIEFKLTSKLLLTIVALILTVILLFDLIPKTVGGYYAVKGESPASMEQLESAIKNTKKAISFDKNSPHYYFHLGELYSKKVSVFDNTEESDEMENSYFTSYKLNPMDFSPPYRIGVNYLAKKDKKAIYYLEEAKRLYPINPNVSAWLSVAYLYLEKDSEKSKQMLDYAKQFLTTYNPNVEFAEIVLRIYKGDFSAFGDFESTSQFVKNLDKILGSTRKGYSSNIETIKRKIVEDVIKSD